RQLELGTAVWDDVAAGVLGPHRADLRTLAVVLEDGAERAADGCRRDCSDPADAGAFDGEDVPAPHRSVDRGHRLVVGTENRAGFGGLRRVSAHFSPQRPGTTEKNLQTIRAATVRERSYR